MPLWDHHCSVVVRHHQIAIADRDPSDGDRGARLDDPHSTAVIDRATGTREGRKAHRRDLFRVTQVSIGDHAERAGADRCCTEKLPQKADSLLSPVAITTTCPGPSESMNSIDVPYGSFGSSCSLGPNRAVAARPKVRDPATNGARRVSSTWVRSPQLSSASLTMAVVRRASRIWSSNFFIRPPETIDLTTNIAVVELFPIALAKIL